MQWHDKYAPVVRFAQVAFVLASSALMAGCFQPLYGARSPTGGPSVRDELAAIDVQQINAAANTPEAHVAVQIRNNLLFSFTGGGSPAPPTHRLVVSISGSRGTTAIDRNSALPSVERYNLGASYSLTEIATNKVVVTGQASTFVPVETVGTQRFARINGMNDAQRRAAKDISDNITARLASFFVAGI